MANVYKMKPVFVEAVQWKGDNPMELRAFGFEGYIGGLEVGCYIVTNGYPHSFTVYTKEHFEKTYERHLVWEDNI